MSDSAERIRHEQLRGTWAMQAEAEMDSTVDRERQQMLLEYGLPSAESIRDRTMPLFTRGRWRFNSGSFMNGEHLEDMRRLGGQDVVIMGAPYDGGTTFRPGTRFGPQAMRRISALASATTPSAAST